MEKDIEGNTETKHIVKPILKEFLQYPLENESDVQKTIQKIGKKFKFIPSKNDLRECYDKNPEKYPMMTEKIYRLLVKRSVRSRSGILNVSVVLPPHRFSCTFDCRFCPKEPGMPRSYLSNEDAVARANQVNFDPVRQVHSRLETLEKNGHPLDKVEFRILGGTFSSYPHDVVHDFITKLYYAVNIYYHYRMPLTLEKEIEWNSQKAQIHVVGLGLETRPDTINMNEIQRFRSFGCTRVELGVQHTDDELLKLCRRGHGIKESKDAIRLLKDHGFKIEMHIMIDLPQSTPEKDKECYQKILQTDSDLYPDYLKDYPCLDVSFTIIKEWKENGKWKPYAEQSKDAKELRDVLVYRQSITPRWVRVNRIMRDFALAQQKTNYLGYSSDTLASNLGEIVRKDAEKQGIYCQCIRCCEIRDETFHPSEIKYHVESFIASDCPEYFISAIIEKPHRPLLLGFIRLRITQNAQLPELKGYIGLVRELHVYGRIQMVLSSDKKNQGTTQHRGIGKTLLQMAENISISKHGVEKMAIISGIGVRSYYQKRGYSLEGTYMTKNVSSWKQKCQTYLQHYLNFY